MENIIFSQQLDEIKGWRDLFNNYIFNHSHLGSDLIRYTNDKGEFVYRKFIEETLAFLSKRANILREINNFENKEILEIIKRNSSLYVNNIRSHIYNINNGELPFKEISYLSNLSDKLLLQTVVVSERELYPYVSKLLKNYFNKVSKTYEILNNGPSAKNSESFNSTIYRFFSNNLFLSLNKNHGKPTSKDINSRWKLVEEGELLFNVSRKGCCKKTLYDWGDSHSISIEDLYERYPSFTQSINNSYLASNEVKCFREDCDSSIILTPLILHYNIEGFPRYKNVINDVIDYVLELNRKIINTLFSVSLKLNKDYKTELMLVLPEWVEFKHNDSSYVFKGKTDIDNKLLNAALYRKI